MRKRRRHNPEEMNFDLTPMIDVTFQLLIFFILVMKFREIEQRHQTLMPTEEGEIDRITDPSNKLTLRMNYQPKDRTTTYWVNAGVSKTPDNALFAGTMQQLFQDRVHHDTEHYRGLYQSLLTRVRDAHAKAPDAEKIELAILGDRTQMSSARRIEKTAPWGFVTLAVDVCSAYNQELRAKGEDALGVTFKNTEAVSGLSTR